MEASAMGMYFWGMIVGAFVFWWIHIDRYSARMKARMERENRKFERKMNRLIRESM